jgi:predicted transcriptional regulator
VIKLHEQGLSNNQIAEALGYEPEAVEMVISSVEKKMRDRGLEDVAIDVMQELATNSVEDSVRQRAAAYILDTLQGQKRPQIHKMPQVNVSVLSLIVDKVKERKEKLLAEAWAKS